MAKKGGKICPPMVSDNVFVIKVPADSKTIIVVSPKVTSPYIKCEKAVESNSNTEKNSKELKADELISNINFNTDSDDGESDFIFVK